MAVRVAGYAKQIVDIDADNEELLTRPIGSRAGDGAVEDTGVVVARN